jgi:hypothetical protein
MRLRHIGSEKAATFMPGPIINCSISGKRGFAVWQLRDGHLQAQKCIKSIPLAGNLLAMTLVSLGSW